MMRKLVFIALFLAAGWSAYWWIGATAQKAALTTWVDERRADDWAADLGEVTVTGYPNRFDTIITDLVLADPASGWSWSAPEFQILALSYKPNHVIAVWPGTHVVASPFERIELSSELMRGSVRLEPDTQLALDQAIIEIDALNAASSLGWTAALAEGQLAIRRAPPGGAPDHGYDVSLTARDLTLPGPLKDALDPAGVLPEAVSRAEIRLTPVFDRIWNRAAIEGENPVLTQLNVGNVSARWGRMEVSVKGTLDIDRLGYPVGTLNVIAQNWQDMLELGVDGGFLTEDIARSLERGLSLVAQLTGDTNRLDVPLNFRDGRAFLGPVPVGDAPRLALRY